MGHAIQPEDSGVGWEFIMADIDFDNKQEMLIAFPANHCGSNALYIYKQEDGQVCSYVDMIATPSNYIVTAIDYKQISPFFDVNLLDAYRNEENRYKYLSVDCSTVCGLHTLILYETGFGTRLTQVEIAKIIYDSNEENTMEFYFCGKKINEDEDLNELLSAYMHGYIKEEVEYISLNKFPRDIVTMDEIDKKQELDKLYETLEKIETDSEEELNVEESNIEESNESKLSSNDVIPYNVPLDEIAERLEYEYAYENMIDYIAEWEQKELGALPVGKDINILVYVVEGNKLLFLPEEKANTDVEINGELCKLYYSEINNGYVFYMLADWQLSEDGIPINSLENDYYHRIRDCIVRERDAVFEETNEVDSIKYYYYQFELEDIVKLGEIKVTFNSESTIILPAIPLEKNEYLEKALEVVEEVYREKQKYGTYHVYLETYGRVQGNYGAYTECKISAAIIGKEVEDYFSCSIGDNDEISDAFFWNFPAREAPPFLTSLSALPTDMDNLMVNIIGLQREVIELEVTPEPETDEIEKNTVELLNYNQDMDFRTMSPQEAAEWINYVYSYGEWFGMNELGCQVGELRGISDEEIIMYTWSNNGDGIYFVPKSKTNTFITNGGGEIYPVFVNKEGEMEFYCLERNIYAASEGQMKTSFFMEYSCSAEYADSLVKIGEAQLTLKELSLLNVSEIKEDEYVMV